jgi:prepilin-type N-terminal cleavage/methylation domain-containing protein/prepilin-type processing-associated H-X9-DG protein
MKVLRRTRSGFTLIELLVVITIIAVLIALLLPAVQSAREAARRAQCVNNLLQLSIAVQNYEAAHEMFPPGVVNPTGPIVEKPLGYHMSWIIQILPYLEHKSLYNHFNMTHGVYEVANSSARSMAVSGLWCPSDVMTSGSGTNYAGCHHDVEAPIDDDNHGVFFLNSTIRYEDLTDGSSQTIFLGEKRLGADLGWVSGTRATLRNTGTAINGPPPVPTTKNPSPVGGFGSRHPGGANFAMGDGGVRFLKNSMAPSVLQLLGHRADGALLSESAY